MNMKYLLLGAVLFVIAVSGCTQQPAIIVLYGWGQPNGQPYVQKDELHVPFQVAIDTLSPQSQYGVRFCPSGSWCGQMGEAYSQGWTPDTIKSGRIAGQFSCWDTCAGLENPTKFESLSQSFWMNGDMAEIDFTNLQCPQQMTLPSGCIVRTGFYASGEFIYSKTAPAPPVTVPAPETPLLETLWNSITSFFADIWTKLSSWLFPQASLVAAANDFYPGDTFSYVATLANTRTAAIPDPDYADGTRSWTYTSYTIYSPSGLQLIPANAQEVVSLAPGASASQPMSYTLLSNAPLGKYTAIAILIEYKKVYDINSKAWTLAGVDKVDEQSVTFNVKSPIGEPAAPSTGDIVSQIQNFFASIFNWIRGLFGL